MSKPIDQEREVPQFIDAGKFIDWVWDLREQRNNLAAENARLVAELEQTRAAVQPAGVAVPEGYVLMPVRCPSWLEDAYDAQCANDGLSSGLHLPAYDAMVSAIAAAPHPVSGEQKPLAYISHGKPGTGEVGLLWDYMPVPVGHTRKIDLYREPPAAQDVAGLVGALEASNLLLRTKRHACTSSQVCHLLDSHIKRNEAALAAHRAQQGEQKAEPRPSWLDGGAEAVAMAKEDEANTVSGLVEALKHARLFIRNGVELGYVRMPDADTPDPAHNTLPKIDAALAGYRYWKGGTPS